jgi:hypothetical protein
MWAICGCAWDKRPASRIVVIEVGDMPQCTRERSGFYPKSSLDPRIKLASANITPANHPTKFFQTMSFFDHGPKKSPKPHLGPGLLAAGR